MSAITKQEVEDAQAIWGQGVVDIGMVFRENGDYTARAKEHVDALYGYGIGGVVFKPTMAAASQFRNDEEGALSYFVGGNARHTEDHGFAIKPWTKVRFENSGIILQGDAALAMGNYFFTDLSGAETKVEYSFGYVRGPNGELRINLHHSSIPFQP
jgi:hypothetical protein